MADAVLSAFVKDALTAGMSRDQITRALKDAGWPEDQTRDALSLYADIDSPVPVPRPRAYGSAREAFLYIVYFSLLGVVAAHVGALSFAWIDALFVDDLDAYGWRAGSSSLRWAIAALIVGYPIFIYLGWRLAERRRRDPERRTSRVRAWLTYVTLIFAAGTLIGDLVAVVYQFLAGGLGERFLAKAGVVGVISGAILWNYSRDAENTKAGVSWSGRLLAIVASIVTALLVVWAFSVVNGPSYARARAADDDRLRDLGTLTRLVDCHYAYFGAAPETLDAMTAALEERTRTEPVAFGCAEETPADPATAARYGYQKLADDRYQLCATFERGWPEEDLSPRRQQIAGAFRGYDERYYVELPYGGGETCFTFQTFDFLKAEENGDG